MGKKATLYSSKKTVESLGALKDAIGRELSIDDYVTAVFSDGELTLFQVIRFEKHTIEDFMDYAQLDNDTAEKWSKQQGFDVRTKGVTLRRSETYDYVVLQRVRGTNAYLNDPDRTDAKLFNSKVVLKTSKQVAYADKEYVSSFVVMNMLSL